MKNGQKKSFLIAMIVSYIFIDAHVFFAPSHLSWAAKWVILALVSLGQLVAVWGFLRMKPWSKKEQKEWQKPVYNLTGKTYLLLGLTATSIYTVGVWLLTPKSLIKDLLLGVFLGVQLLALLLSALKRVREKADERFYANLAKAATLMFVLCILTLLLLAAASALLGSITVNAGLFFMTISLLALIFDVAFYLFERGG